MKNRIGKKTKLFCPDAIVTQIRQNVLRDLAAMSQEYHSHERISKYVIDLNRTSLTKKYVFETNDQELLEDLTFQKFLEVNDHMRSSDEGLTLPLPDARIQSSTSEVDAILIRAKALIKAVLTPFTQEEFFQECSHSSGSSIGVPFSDTSIERKWTLPISITENAKSLFNQYMLYDSELYNAVEDFNSQHPVGGMYDIVEASRATTVDKTDKIRRMIAVEPTGNMFLQQGVMAMMYKRLKSFGLDVTELPKKHTQLAFEGSITGRLATIDFSSASDCVSTKLLGWILPPQWFRVLNQLRASHITIRDERIKLNMFSTMGNAGTFPVETLLFWALAVSATRAKEQSNSLLFSIEEKGSCSVFGDDCILPTQHACVFMQVCNHVGFIVNKEKSFFDTQGGFRESCGGDYLHGINVRPLFLTRPTSNRMSALEPWLYIILNGILKKYIQYFGPLTYIYNRHALTYIFRLFREYKVLVKPVPLYYPDDAGLISDDLARLSACYSPAFSRVSRSHHGTLSFLFCSYKYRDTRKTDDGLRYAQWLKKPLPQPKAHSQFQKTRRIGGYSVADRKSVV